MMDQSAEVCLIVEIKRAMTGEREIKRVEPGEREIKRVEPGERKLNTD